MFIAEQPSSFHDTYQLIFGSRVQKKKKNKVFRNPTREEPCDF